MDFLAIPRSADFSPNMANADTAIFYAVVEGVVRQGNYVLMLADDEWPEESEELLERTDDRVICMSRDVHTLQWLAGKGYGTRRRCLNSPQGIMACSDRRTVYETLRKCGVPQPETFFCPLTDNGLQTAFEHLAHDFDRVSYWVKRGQGYTQRRDDVVLCRSEEECKAALMELRSRTVEAAVCQHIEGDIVKFYGVAGTGFFDSDYADPAHSKFGLEVANGPVHRYTFDVEQLHALCDRAAESLGVPIYGGDAIVQSDGRFFVIDFNDWPSFSRCRDSAAQAIVQRLLQP